MRLNAIITFRGIFSNSSFIVTIMFSIYVVTQICRSCIMSHNLPVLGNKYSILLNYRCTYIYSIAVRVHVGVRLRGCRNICVNMEYLELVPGHFKMLIV